MNPLEILEQLAYEKGIEVYDFALRRTPSVAMCYNENEYYIAIDPDLVTTTALRTVAMAHEFMHIEYRAINSNMCAHDSIAKNEQKAWRKAIEFLLPKSVLEAKLVEYQGNVYEMSEDLDLPVEFIRRAYDHYAHAA